MSLHELTLDDPQQLKALGHEVRARIVRMLEDRPASAQEISRALEMTHGKVGHHMNVLADAGLIEVVEERQVRALTEKVYGLTFEKLTLSGTGIDRLAFALRQAGREAAAEQPFEPPAALLTVRMTEEAAAAIHTKLIQLADEFTSLHDPEGEGFGFLGSVFATDTPRP